MASVSQKMEELIEVAEASVQKRAVQQIGDEPVLLIQGISSSRRKWSRSSSFSQRTASPSASLSKSFVDVSVPRIREQSGVMKTPQELVRNRTECLVKFVSVPVPPDRGKEALLLERDKKCYTEKVCGKNRNSQGGDPIVCLQRKRKNVSVMYPRD